MTESQLKIHSIYASTGGNTQYVVEHVARYWQKNNQHIQLHRAEKTSISVIADNQFFLFATSTWDHGSINPFFNRLLSEITQTNCAGKRASFIGLGDRRYEPYYFCAGIHTLREAWEKSGGESIGIPLTIGREPFEAELLKTVENWADEILPTYTNPTPTTTSSTATTSTVAPTVPATTALTPQTIVTPIVPDPQSATPDNRREPDAVRT